MKSICFELLKTSVAVSAIFVGGVALASAVTSPATVRTGPGSRWPVIAEIPAGADVEVLSCGQGWKRAWCRVQYGATTGFVKAGTLAPSGSSDVVIAPVVTTDLANLRRGPGPKWAAIGVIPPSAEVNLLYCSHAWHGDRCKVSNEGMTGFVHGSLLQRQGAMFPL